MMDGSELFEVLPLYYANLDCKKRFKVNQGGTSSGKTYSIIQLLFLKGILSPNKVITVVGQDIPNLKKGAYRDAKRIRDNSAGLQEWYPKVNEGYRLIQCVNGSIIEFASFADAQDAKSGKRDILFINEANGVSWEIFWQLNIRTKDEVYIDYNPSARFWVHENLIGRDDVQLILSDHRKNTFLTEEQHETIERIKNEDIELWKVYARGATGSITGLVFPHFNVVEELPPVNEWKMQGYGLDFGFTNDPTALVHVVLAHGELWLDEILYNTDMTNPDISQAMKDNNIRSADEVIADSAEPKSIRELQNMGMRGVRACSKGADSIRQGIDIMKRYTLNVTRRSMGLRKELLAYKWRVNRDGQQTGEPVDSFNHALDAVRYWCLERLKAATAVRGIKVRR